MPDEARGYWDWRSGRQRWPRLRRALLGIQFKSTLAVVAMTLAVAAPMWWLLGRATAELTERLQRRQCVRTASLLARSAVPLLVTNDLARLRLLVDEQVDGESILYLSISDSNGQVLASTAATHGSGGRRESVDFEHLPAAPVGTPAFHPAVAATPALLDVTYPIVDGRDHQNRRLGYARLGFSVQWTMDDLASAQDLVSGVGIGLLLLTVPLGFLVVRRVVMPLDELVRTMRRFSAGDLAARSTVKRDDEIGALATAFNQMAEIHAHSHEQIVTLNAELEERVFKRTRQLRELAVRDPLTGLYNRRHFNEMLSRRLSEARRYDSDLSCMMIDLDNFKLINDRCGHHAGDQVLVLAATTISAHLRAADVAARYGGDEFVILLPQTNLEQAAVLSQRIRQKFAAELGERMPDRLVRLSIGVASRREQGDADPEALLRAADRAMYRDKSLAKTSSAPVPAAV